MALRLATACCLMGLLGACGAGGVADPTFWVSSPIFVGNDEAELGLAELTKGNYGMAEAHFNKALSRDDRDVQALMGLGVLYQNTGQLTKARQSYEAVLAIRPSNTQQMLVLRELSHRPISELASVNLALLEGGGVMPTSAATGASGAMPFNPPPNAPTMGMVSGQPASSPMLGRMPPRAATGSASPAMQNANSVPQLGNADATIVSRFNTLRALRDQGLITPEEFGTRRQSNLGALVPLTTPPPAAGLDRPVPNAAQITGRLRAIGRALEMRAITISQHSAERSMILDALMPAAPVAVAPPAQPPKGLMEAADSVRRLEQLQGSGLITSDEYARERQAIEKGMQPPGARAAAAPKASSEGKATMASGSQAAVHLASYRSRQAAERGWTQFRRAHSALIGNLEHQISRIDLGRGKGVYFRLIAGPIEGARSAKNLCDRLKRRRQYCEPAVMGAG